VLSRTPPGHRAAFILTAVGTGALLSTLFEGWFTTSLSAGSFAPTETLLPMWVQLSGSQGGSSYSDLVAYSGVGMDHTGTLYLVVTVLIVIGTAMGFLAALLMRKNSYQIRRKLVSSVVVIAVICALAGPSLLAFEQPDAICSDYVLFATPLAISPANSTNGGSLPCGWDVYSPNGQGGYGADSGSTGGPQSSFFGSENGTGALHTWGPSVGWYVAIVAAGLLLGGFAPYVRGGRRSTPAIGTESHRQSPVASNLPGR
jgi:hypothetical protein